MVKWIRSTIGAKLLVAISLVLILSIVSLIFVATQQVAEFGEFAASTSEANIRDNANAFMARITHEQAMRYASTFNKFATSSYFIAKQTAFILDNIDLYGSKPLKPNEKLAIYPHNKIFSNDASQETMVLYWGSTSLLPEINEQISALSHLDPHLKIVKEGNPEIVACYAVTEPGIARYYPNIHGVEKLPPTAKFDIRNANWYVIAKPENNPERKTVWSNIYLDSVGQGLMTTASTPVYSKTGEYLGATGVDVTLDTIVNDMLAHIPSCHKMEGMFSFLTDHQGRIIAFPPEYLDMFELKIDQDRLKDATVILKYSLLDSSNAEIRKIAQGIIDKKFQISRFFLNERPYMISSHFMPSTEWRLGIVVPESIILASVEKTRNALDSTVNKMTTRFTVVTILFLIGAIIIITLFSIKNLIRPLRNISEGAKRVQEGDLTTHVDINRKDEIGSLASSFNSMVDALRKGKEMEIAYTQNLEKEVKARTREITIRNEELKNTLRELKQEVSERKKAEEALLESEKKYRTVVEESFDGIFVQKGPKIVFASKRLHEMLGYDEGELLGLDHWLVYHPDYHELTRNRALARMSGEKVPNRYEVKLHRKDGSWFYGEIIAREIDFAGEPGVQVWIRDITERKQADNEKRLLEFQLQQAQKMEAIGTLAGGIAHDFNNILAAIIGYTEIASLQVADDNKAKESLNEVLKAGHRAKNLVNQILAFSRPGDEGRKPIQVTSIMKEALKLLRATLPATIEIRQNIEIDSGQDTILADPTQIHEVLMNLCTNAAHAMRENGGILEIGLQNVEHGIRNSEFEDDERKSPMQILLSPVDLDPGQYLRLTVSDTGHGMTPEVIKRIFDPYFTTKDKGEGTGMGLSVVHGIIKSHGGRITVYSEQTKGSTFHVYLPLIQEMTKEPDIDKGAPVLTGDERILFVDDEHALVEIAKDILERLGYEVVTRTSSVEALELFRAQADSFDLVITDMTMPNMTGDKLSRELMKIRSDIPIVLCTGYSERISEEKAKSMGIREFVMKPLVMKDLAKTVRKALDT
jgi:PAS domain S-box-containing protein